MRPYIKLLSHPPARRYFIAYAQSSAGTGMGYIALLLIAYQQAHSAWAVSAVLLADYLPSMLFGALLGVVLDRTSRKHCAVLGDLMSAAAFIGLAFANTLPAVFCLALLAGVGSALNGPAVMAAMPSLVPDEDMPAATALYNALEKAGFVLGPLLGTVLLALGGIPTLMIINGASFAVSAIIVSTLKFGKAPAREEEQEQESEGASVWREARDGLAAVRSLPSVGALVASSGVAAACFAAFAVSEVVFATDVFHLSSGAFAALFAVMSVTMTFGSLSGASSRGTRAFRARYLQGMVVLGVGLAMIAAAPAMWLVFAGYLLTGFGNGVESVHDRLLVTELVPDEVRGRVFSLRNSVLSWSAASMMILGGGLVTVLGARQLIAFAAAGVLITWTLNIWRSPGQLLAADGGRWAPLRWLRGLRAPATPATATQTDAGS